MGKYVKITRARELRKDETEAERTLWRYLRNQHLAGRKFRRQYPLHGYILDFYCAEENLAIELDGPVHDRQKDYDSARQKIIESHGVKVIRFKNSIIMNNINTVLDSIRKACAFPSPSAMERGVVYAPAGEVGHV
jgi:very-short-patch-repair endonuclease